MGRAGSSMKSLNADNRQLGQTSVQHPSQLQDTGHVGGMERQSQLGRAELHGLGPELHHAAGVQTQVGGVDDHGPLEPVQQVDQAQASGAAIHDLDAARQRQAAQTLDCLDAHAIVLS